ncbi:Multidrug resistance protein MdtE [Dyadobacter sp. CECT 9275]|uniref:Multidrug resistance protein MdtE n=1 Tax=Dyadobacter helix TaxID=2822344 RepID=A0A916JCC0_9BACT|nr:efflux RND transporter periplasmic adaptor subunit [Dyadobacter sp. CECT 9275]CAG5002686.1 Multidrug resistance protein MdtE [Dyadobacter sp. CECT 9275]
MNLNVSINKSAALGRLSFTHTISFLILTGTLLAQWGCKEKKDTFQQKNTGPTTVDVIVAKSEKIGDHVEVNGTVVANEFAELRPEVSGLLTFLNVPEGQIVKKGTVIAKINSADLAAQLNKLKVQLQLAETTESRLKKLIEINGVNQADYDAAVNSVNTIQADIRYYQALIDKTIVKAPFTGMVGLRKVSAGAYLTSGSVIATMQQLNQLRIDFTVPEVYQRYVKKGGSVEVNLDPNGQSTQPARIIATEPLVDQSTRNITVRAVLGNVNTSPGSFAKVYLNAGAEKSAILVPTNCIIPEAKSKKIVTVKDGKAAFVVVETGDRQEDYVEITNGLSQGDTVVVSGVLFTRPDAPVKIRNVRSVKVVQAK